MPAVQWGAGELSSGHPELAAVQCDELLQAALAIVTNLCLHGLGSCYTSHKQLVASSCCCYCCCFAGVTCREKSKSGIQSIQTDGTSERSGPEEVHSYE
eukprot:scaffold38056_cov21-Tisochrysis_lutea.AAC.1